MQVGEIRGQRVIEYPEDGPVIATPQQALDLIGNAFAAEAVVVMVPAGRLAPEFFRLATGFAGEVMQKFQNYRMRLMVFGDISEHVAASTALRDFVKETNRVGHHVFGKDRATCEAAI